MASQLPQQSDFSQAVAQRSWGLCWGLCMLLEHVGSMVLYADESHLTRGLGQHHVPLS